MDKIRYEVLEDGTITIDTEGISGKNHLSADQMLEALAEMIGGKVEVKHKHGHLAAHSHSHGDIGHRHSH